MIGPRCFLAVRPVRSFPEFPLPANAKNSDEYHHFYSESDEETIEHSPHNAKESNSKEYDEPEELQVGEPAEVELRPAQVLPQALLSPGSSHEPRHRRAFSMSSSVASGGDATPLVDDGGILGFFMNRRSGSTQSGGGNQGELRRWGSGSLIETLQGEAVVPEPPLSVGSRRRHNSGS